MDNRFVILIGSYNNEDWVAANLDSVLCQTYKNFKIIYYNAASTDKTGEIANDYALKDHRITYVTTKERYRKTWFFEHAYQFDEIRDNDVVCILDGDDFLANESVLRYLNDVYNNSNCWMTYGGMIVWNGEDSTQEAYPQNSEPPIQVHQQKLYRQDLWRYAHFRTSRGFLWKRIDPSGFKSVHDGEYMTLDDLCTVWPMLEMCPYEKIYRVDQTIYIWNNSKANESRGCTENKVNNIGAIYEGEIRSRPKYKELAVISPTLAGGLGNQMFEVAAAASLAKDNNARLVINPNEHILPNQGRNIKNYLNTVFQQIATDDHPHVKEEYHWDHIYYSPIPFKPHLKLFGHYQSYKYFDHNRKYIQDLLGFTSDILKEKYSKFTAIQVRRGDYYKFPDHHPLLPVDYYVKAVKIINPEQLIVFSDDITWCKNNFDFGIPTEYGKGESDDMEMAIMEHCPNLIISNSSFGWWAAYLNRCENKRIFVPDPWFGPALIKDGYKAEDLILPEWTQVKI